MGENPAVMDLICEILTDRRVMVELGGASITRFVNREMPQGGEGSFPTSVKLGLEPRASFPKKSQQDRCRIRRRCADRNQRKVSVFMQTTLKELEI